MLLLALTVFRASAVMIAVTALTKSALTEKQKLVMQQAARIYLCLQNYPERF
jgi:hypothetical protein